MMDVKERIDEIKTSHEKEMSQYNKNINSYIDKHGNDKCDYLMNQVNMSNYHRGAANAMIELSRSIFPQ